jgi:hypothetical protein
MIIASKGRAGLLCRVHNAAAAHLHTHLLAWEELRSQVAQPNCTSVTTTQPGDPPSAQVPLPHLFMATDATQMQVCLLMFHATLPEVLDSEFVLLTLMSVCSSQLLCRHEHFSTVHVELLTHVFLFLGLNLKNV